MFHAIFNLYFFLPVPPDKPVLKLPSGREVHSYEIGPFEVDQDLVLECDVTGGNVEILQ